MSERRAQIIVTRRGAIATLRPMTDAALVWLRCTCEADPLQWDASGLSVDSYSAAQIALTAQEEGFRISVN